jgi:tetratricopeptide (TPR) repeat protein
VQGRYDEALASARKAREFSAGNREVIALIGQTYGMMGRREAAEKILTELQALSKLKFVPPYNIATVHLDLGEMDGALESLAKAHDVRHMHMVFLGAEPKWDPLRSHPRFERLLCHAGVPHGHRPPTHDRGVMAAHGFGLGSQPLPTSPGNRRPTKIPMI